MLNNLILVILPQQSFLGWKSDQKYCHFLWSGWIDDDKKSGLNLVTAQFLMHHHSCILPLLNLKGACMFENLDTKWIRWKTAKLFPTVSWNLQHQEGCIVAQVRCIYHIHGQYRPWLTPGTEQSTDLTRVLIVKLWAITLTCLTGGPLSQPLGWHLENLLQNWVAERDPSVRPHQ